MERPAFQRLLSEVSAGKIDVRSFNIPLAMP
jgi:DNA invertase Pin-like site-specific DNA recombinase